MPLIPPTCRNFDDRQTLWGGDVFSPPNLSLLGERLEHGPLIVEHRFCRGTNPPDRLIFNDIDELKSYVETRSGPGDAFLIWDFETVCRKENHLICGRKPAEGGRTPEGGVG